MNASLSSAFGTLSFWNASLLLLLVKATIILIAALGITLGMQRTSATARHLVWLVTLGALLFVPALTAWGPLRVAVLPAPIVAHSASAVEPVTPASSLVSPTDQASPIATAVPNVESVPTSTSPSAMSRLVTWLGNLSGLSLVLAIWLAVVVGIIVTLAWAGLTVRRIVRRARPLESPDWLNPLFEIADRLGLEDSPRLLQSDDAKMPFACGVLKPTIVLPAESEAWSLDRRRAVLLHELAHVRRHDLLGHTLGRLACAVYWFHPLVWTAARRLRSESERACDDLALACGTRATDYAEHLLDIVTSVRGDSTPLVALAMARRKEFEGRMLAILDPDLRHSTPSRRQSAALIATLALISLTVGAVAPVQRTANAAAVNRQAVRKGQDAAAPTRPAEPTSPRLTYKQYPDSGVPGVISYGYQKHTSTSNTTSMVQSQTMSTGSAAADAKADAKSEASADAKTEALANARLAPRGSSIRAIQALAASGEKLGIDVATGMLQILSDKGDKGDKGAKTDDRPVLLAKVLRSDTSASLRRIAAWGLQEYAGSQVGAEALAKAVRNDVDVRVREMAAWSSAQGSEREGITFTSLSMALSSDASERVRATAAWALGELGDRRAMEGLSTALNDPNPDVRIRAAWAIGTIGPKSAPKALVAMLSDKDARIRQLTAWALFNIEDPSTIGAIQSALKSETDKEVQLSEIRALAALGEKSVDALRDLIESPDPRVKSMAVRALAGGRATGPWPWPWPEPRPYP